MNTLECFLVIVKTSGFYGDKLNGKQAFLIDDMVRIFVQEPTCSGYSVVSEYVDYSIIAKIKLKLKP